ncbi:MAG TPA: D-glucuronyl C5-epimerase family protein [Ktedonobacteraceae bacterium]|jgi:glycosyltransferase involved in cell wall biosynthesis
MKQLAAYPLDLSALLHGAAGILSQEHPVWQARQALAHWNRWLARGEDAERAAFLAHARWLLAHEMPLANGAGVWPVQQVLPAYHAHRPWLSALAQSCAISVLLRAWQVSGEAPFLQATHRAVRPFELDILDQGVCALLSARCAVFEEVAVYPAAHTLRGHLLALLGLHEYLALTARRHSKVLIARGLAALSTLLEEFDCGYWTRADLLARSHLADHAAHALHILLLETLAEYTGNQDWAAWARRWAGYQRRPLCRLRRWWHSRVTGRLASWLAYTLRRGVLGVAGDARLQTAPPAREEVCVPIPRFPVAGGMNSALAGIALAMQAHWHLVYLTAASREQTSDLEIETFAGRYAHPWQFPGVWLYVLAGVGALLRVLRRRPGCRLLLPQDGLATGAFSALVGRLAGARVVCIDHGNLTWLTNPTFRQERERALQDLSWPRRPFARARFAWYWPSLRLLARLCARWSDCYLLAGAETAEAARQFTGLPASRVLRYHFLIDLARFSPPDAARRAQQRQAEGLPAQAILISMINRLAVEKGLDSAIAGLALAMEELAPEVRARVRFLIAGEGPLRARIQAELERFHLQSIGRLWGNASAAQVALLLGISDIFLYNGTRGVNSVAVLEAMAAGCAVVATSVPRTHIQLLAHGRGLAIEPHSPRAVACALSQLCTHTHERQQMGQRARAYVATHHSEQGLRRALWRATFFAPELVPATPSTASNAHNR